MSRWYRGQQVLALPAGMYGEIVEISPAGLSGWFATVEFRDGRRAGFQANELQAASAPAPRGPRLVCIGGQRIAP